MASINDFLGAFKGGTRVNRFRVNVNNCPYLTNGDIEIHIRAASFPQMDVIPFPVNFKGKTVNVPAVRSFVPWVITVMDDVPVGLVSGGTVNNTDLHKRFMNWSDSIVDTGEAMGVGRLADATGTNNYWQITHLDHKSDAALKTFKISNCWPIQVGPIQMDMNENARIAMFNVTLAYSHITDV